jgi:hypothetical protein
MGSAFFLFRFVSLSAPPVGAAITIEYALAGAGKSSLPLQFVLAMC